MQNSKIRTAGPPQTIHHHPDPRASTLGTAAGLITKKYTPHPMPAATAPMNRMPAITITKIRPGPGHGRPSSATSCGQPSGGAPAIDIEKRIRRRHRLRRRNEYRFLLLRRLEPLIRRRVAPRIPRRVRPRFLSRAKAVDDLHAAEGASPGGPAPVPITLPHLPHVH